MEVLVTDPADDQALKYLKDNGIKVNYFPNITPEELEAKIPFFQGILVRSRTKVDKNIIERGKKLRVVGRIGSGFDNIDINECRKQGISVVNAPSANSEAVAELTIGLIITLLRREDAAIFSMKEGKWIKDQSLGKELAGKAVGILGYGNVGKRVSKILKSFSCQLLIYSRSFKTVTLDELFRRSNIVTIHLSLNKETRGIVGERQLDLMKKDSYLVNTSRGAIIEEKILYSKLAKGEIAGAALDVFWQEPLLPSSKWRKLKNVVLTPHIGGSTIEALTKASLTVCQDVVKILKGKRPLHLIT